jgi:chromosome segregation ATPase
MIEKIKKEIGRPASWAYFVLVVALLYIVSDNSKSIKGLQAEIDNAITEISTLEALNETTLEAMAKEVAVRDDAIAGLKGEIVGWKNATVEVSAKLRKADFRGADLEAEVADLQAELSAKLNQVDSVRVGLEVEVADLQAELSANTLALNDARWRLDDALENPNCPVTE